MLGIGVFRGSGVAYGRNRYHNSFSGRWLLPSAGHNDSDSDE